LNSAYIRAALVRAFASVGRPTPIVPQTIVYAHPTIRALSNWLWKELSGTSGPTGPGAGVTASVATVKEMIRGQLDLLADSEHSDSRTGVNGTNGAVPAEDRKRTVLVTGTTGGLGAHLLETLLMDLSVGEIFALNRRSRSAQVVGVHSRQGAAFEKRGIDQELLKSPKLTFVDADRVEDIEPDVINQVRSKRIFILHSFRR
jgi:Male sterility protein